MVKFINAKLLIEEKEMTQLSSNQQQIMNSQRQIRKLVLNRNLKVITYVAKLNKQDCLIKIEKQQLYYLKNLHNRTIIILLMYLALCKSIVSLQQLIRLKHINLAHTINKSNIYQLKMK
ncbi:hypothetical protein SS50377_27723 [Spironucleus salmonicida]|uniref:Uncharacterized protein n=1 Tax=Spironucleus salmonicida TaxID=348837 RepID=A0A9P8LKR5_9EUKA|nr:hypothetical protein SS50377_27723 [Spironucleus salmonicida]